MQQMNQGGMDMEIANASMSAGKKEGKGMMMGMVACAVLAITGIGFGVYEMLQVNKAKQEISDLRVEIKKDDGTTNTIETDKIEVKEENKTIVIADTNTSTPTIFDPSGNLNWTEEQSGRKAKDITHQTSMGYMGLSDDGLSFSAAFSLNGIGEKYKELTQGKNYKISFNDRVTDFYVSGWGQAAGYETIFFLMEDSTVEYTPIYYAIKNDDFRSYGKVEEVKDIVKFQMTNVYGAEGGGWVTTIALRSDGKWYDLSVLKDSHSEYYDYNSLFLN